MHRGYLIYVVEERIGGVVLAEIDAMGVLPHEFLDKNRSARFGDNNAAAGLGWLEWVDVQELPWAKAGLHAIAHNVDGVGVADLRQ